MEIKTEQYGRYYNLYCSYLFPTGFTKDWSTGGYDFNEVNRGYCPLLRKER